MKPVELKPERNTAIPDDDDSNGPISTEDDVVVVTASDQKSQSVKPKENPKQAAKPISKQPVRKKSDRSAVWALLAFFVVLFIGALIYFNRPTDSASENSVTVNEPATQELGTTDIPETDSDIEVVIGNNETNAETLDESTNEEPSMEQIPQARVSSQVQMYGLTGNVVDEANSGYSIVIHSFYNEIRADEVAENLRADGYRVQISARVINGLDVWRVSLGQFENIPDAQEAAETLPEPFNENNFIQRIQRQ